MSPSYNSRPNSNSSADEKIFTFDNINWTNNQSIDNNGLFSSSSGNSSSHSPDLNTNSLFPSFGGVCNFNNQDNENNGLFEPFSRSSRSSSQDFNSLFATINSSTINSPDSDRPITSFDDNFLKYNAINSDISFRDLQPKVDQICSLDKLPTSSSKPGSRKISDSSNIDLSVFEEKQFICTHPDHTETDYYCYDCYQKVCFQCIQLQHNSHNYLVVPIYVEIMEETDRLKHLVKENIVSLENRVSNLHAKKTLALRNIKKFFDGYRALVDKKELELLNDVNYIAYCRSRILSQKLKENENIMQSNSEMLQKLSSCIRKGDTDTVVNECKVAKTHIELLRNLPKTSTQAEEEIVFVGPDNPTVIPLREMGVILCPSYVSSMGCSNVRERSHSDSGLNMGLENGANFPTYQPFGPSQSQSAGTSFDNNGFYNSSNVLTPDNLLGPNCGFVNDNDMPPGSDKTIVNTYSCPDAANTTNSGFTLNNFINDGGNYLNSHNFLGNGLPLPSPNANLECFSGQPVPSTSGQLVPSTSGQPVPSTSGQLVPSTSGQPVLSSQPLPYNSFKNDPSHGPLDNMSDLNPFPVSFHTRRNYAKIKKPVLVFGQEGSGDKDLCRPWGVCCDRKGHIIVADRSNNRISIFRTDGSHVKCFGKHGSEEGEFNRPAGVAIDFYGRIVVADKDNHRIQVLTLDGEFVFSFGERGQTNGRFHYPWDVDVNSAGVIVVSDTRNHRIQLFSGNGIFLKKFGFENMSNMWKYFDSPRGVCFTPENTVMVTDFNNHKLYEVEFNKNVRLLNNENFKRCELFRPQGVAMDAEGNVLVADCRNNRIQVFSRNGELLGQFGVAGKEFGQFDRPSGISLTPDGKIVVVDFGNHRIQVF